MQSRILRRAFGDRGNAEGSRVRNKIDRGRDGRRFDSAALWSMPGADLAGQHSERSDHRYSRTRPSSSTIRAIATPMAASADFKLTHYRKTGGAGCRYRTVCRPLSSRDEPGAYFWPKIAVTPRLRR